MDKIKDISFADDLDMLTEILYEIRSQDPDMRRMADEIETRERLEELKLKHPAVYSIFQMIERGDIEYEHGLQKLCIHLIEKIEYLEELVESDLTKKATYINMRTS